MTSFFYVVSIAFHTSVRALRKCMDTSRKKSILAESAATRAPPAAPLRRTWKTCLPSPLWVVQRRENHFQKFLAGINTSFFQFCSQLAWHSPCRHLMELQNIMDDMACWSMAHIQMRGYFMHCYAAVFLHDCFNCCNGLWCHYSVCLTWSRRVCYRTNAV